MIAHALTFKRFAAALFFLAVAAAACVMPAQSDTWWHLRAGEEIWRLRAVPLRDSFSHTAYGGYWPDHEWLTQVVFFGLYRAGGLKLLTAVLAAIVTATWVLVWHLTPGNWQRRLALAGLALIPSSIAWSLRPQVFTLFLLALTAFLLTRRRLWWLPPLFLVWANLHGAVLLGIVVLLAATAGIALTDRRQAYHLLGVTLLCVVATTITPLGVSFWTEMPASIERIDQYRIAEWRAPQLSDPALVSFWLLGSGLAVLLVRQKPWRTPECFHNVMLCGAVALMPLALTAARNIPPLMIFAVPAIAALLESPRRLTPARAVRIERPLLNIAVLAAAIVVAFGSVVSAWQLEISRLGWQPLPKQAITALASCPERLYNRYDEGGFLIWFARSQLVFLDGRQDPYPPELIIDQLRLESSGEYEATFIRHDIRCAFIPSDSVLDGRLTDAGWQTMYRDATWTVLATPVKRSEP